MITLAPYQNAHYAALTAYRLPDEQNSFTAPPREWLNDTPLPAHIHPVSILDHDEPIGFFILDNGDDKYRYTGNPHALLLRSMSIHPAHQGKGAGKQALLALPAFVAAHSPAATEIVLGVHHQNHGANALYQRVGFHDTGRLYHGIKGAQHIMSLDLETQSTKKYS